jgi:hypothetical protein
MGRRDDAVRVYSRLLPVVLPLSSLIGDSGTTFIIICNSVNAIVIIDNSVATIIITSNSITADIIIISGGSSRRDDAVRLYGRRIYYMSTQTLLHIDVQVLILTYRFFFVLTCRGFLLTLTCILFGSMHRLLCRYTDTHYVYTYIDFYVDTQIRRSRVRRP